MIAIYILLLIVNTLFTKILYSTISKPNTLFNVFWCSCGGLSTLGLFGLDKPDDLVHIYSFICVIVFNIVYFFITKLNSKGRNKSIDKDYGNPNYRIIYLFNLMCWVYSIPFLIKSIKIIRQFGFNELRRFAYTSSDALATTNQILMFNWIIESVFIVTMLICSIDIALKKTNKKLIVILVIDIVIYTVLFGGRTTILQPVLFTAIAYHVIYGRMTFAFIKKNLKLVILFIIMIIVFSYLTTLRSIEGKNVIENMFIYFVGPFVFLSKQISSKPWVGNLLYGKATFGFVLGLISIFNKFIFEIDYNGASKIIPAIIGPFMMIGYNVPFNFLTTMIFPFLMDFGVCGVVIGPAIYSMFIALVHNWFYRRGTYMSLCLYVFILYGIPLSVMNYYYFDPKYGFILIFMYIFNYKVIIKHR